MIAIHPALSVGFDDTNLQPGTVLALCGAVAMPSCCPCVVSAWLGAALAGMYFQSLIATRLTVPGLKTILMQTQLQDKLAADEIVIIDAATGTEL